MSVNNTREAVKYLNVDITNELENLVFKNQKPNVSNKVVEINNLDLDLSTVGGTLSEHNPLNDIFVVVDDLKNKVIDTKEDINRILTLVQNVVRHVDKLEERVLALETSGTYKNQTTMSDFEKLNNYINEKLENIKKNLDNDMENITNRLNNVSGTINRNIFNKKR